MIRLQHLRKVFPTRDGEITAVDDVSLELPAGEICVLLGPSGCGKTTTMKMINRLVQPTSGKIFIDGRDTASVDPIQLRRTIGYVIQQVGLFPNKTVADNICTVPDLLGWDRNKARARAGELLELVGMEPAIFMNRYPRELSGGQQQRVGVLRALAADPPVMLMDEPFGAIDPINREVIQDEFLRMQQTLRKTIIFVSHDLDEAVKMADKIAIFRAGRLEQFASPERLLARPATGFVESFLGSDRALKQLRLVRVADAMVTGDGVTQAGDVARARDIMQRSGLPAAILVDGEGRPAAYVQHGALEPQPVRATVPVSADLRSAVSLMFAQDMTVLPCVDDGGLLKGVLTHRSIVDSLARSRSAS
ncbi:ABC transporter ATP-binding protein [Rhodoligotrophos defluvii]|uniref:ABC transporter ATP-binding protein n=1 Tax=Rhodoligotrophos defluvii TaxID=2561934 RepID=UPI0010C9D81C|nr:ABC transporter ATP-binding protein [Rhodoligotrophos defluvii]